MLLSMASAAKYTQTPYAQHTSTLTPPHAQAHAHIRTRTCTRTRTDHMHALTHTTHILTLTKTLIHHHYHQYDTHCVARSHALHTQHAQAHNWRMQVGLMEGCLWRGQAAIGTQELREKLRKSPSAGYRAPAAPRADAPLRSLTCCHTLDLKSRRVIGIAYLGLLQDTYSYFFLTSKLRC